MKEEQNIFFSSRIESIRVTEIRRNLLIMHAIKQINDEI